MLGSVYFSRMTALFLLLLLVMEEKIETRIRGYILLTGLGPSQAKDTWHAEVFFSASLNGYVLNP